MSGFEGVEKGKRNRDDETDNDDTDVKKTKIITEYDVYGNSDEAYELLRENDDIKIYDIIHVKPNNQEGY